MWPTVGTLSFVGSTLQEDPSYDVSWLKLVHAVKGEDRFLLRPETIVMLHHAEKYTTLFTDWGETFITEYAIKHLIQAFPRIWLRLNRAYAVQAHHLAYVKNAVAYTRDGDAIQLSRRQAQNLTRMAFFGTRGTPDGRKYNAILQEALDEI